MSSPAQLSRADALWIRAHKHELGGIPSPDVCWAWASPDIPYATKKQLSYRGLIVQTPDGWMTTEALYGRLQDLGVL